MNLIGVDVGSDSVRVSIRNQKTGLSHDSERPLLRTQEGSKHTMSGPALWAEVVSMLADYDVQFSALNGASSGRKDDYEVQSIPNPGKPVKPSILCADQKADRIPGSGANRDTDKKHAAQKLLEPRDTQKKVLPPAFPQSAVCVAATCSMVVMRRTIDKKGRSCFRPIQPGAEVIVWMDTRARAEAQWVSRRLPQPALAQIGGTVTPEMGIAKLKWISNNVDSFKFTKTQEDAGFGAEICIFELYDWVTYLFLAGGYRADGSVACLESDVPHFAPGQMAMDGSVKGWGSDILKILGLAENVSICCAPNQLEPKNPFPYVGTPLGSLGQLTVAHGCIDCYAGWAGQVATAGSGAKKDGDGPTSDLADEKSESAPCSLLMVAGTSTCFIASVDQKSSDITRPIPGLWGPFAQLLASPVYSFGQPATGQLFAELFEEHSDLIGENPPFSFIEKNARAIEQKHRCPLPVLARHYLYYGDKHGNRSPYGDFRMGEIFVGGTNASTSDVLSCTLNQNTLESLVLKYYLTIEFLVFQTAQLCRRLAAVCGPVRDVYISGSQAQNARLVEMLSVVAFPNSRVFIRKGTNSKFAGSQGIALAMVPFITQKSNTRIGENDGISADARGLWSQVTHAGSHAQVEEDQSRVNNILHSKYGAFESLAEWQSQFRKNMGEL